MVKLTQVINIFHTFVDNVVPNIIHKLEQIRIKIKDRRYIERKDDRRKEKKQEMNNGIQGRVTRKVPYL